MGMLTSGFVVANVAEPAAAAAAVYVPKWAPRTTYPVGQQVVSPNNDVVSANVAHTSSTAYATDTANWVLSATFASKATEVTVTSGRLSYTSLASAYASRWQPTTAYLAGVAVLNPTGDTVTAIANFTSGTTYDTADWKLSASYAPVAEIEPMLLQRAAASKGAVIGVGEKAVVALRFDDWQAAFKANIFALLTARGLPAGYAMISRFAEQPSWTAGVTTADLVEWNQNGIEVHSHGTNHKDPSPQGDAGLIDQIVNSKAEITAWGVKCQGWMQPGATQLGTQIPYGQTATFNDLIIRSGQLIRQTYPFSEMEIDGVRRNLPHGAYHGLDHVTVSDGMSLADAKLNVDDAVSHKLGIELMCHSGNLGSIGMSVNDFTALLDYIVAKRDAGMIEVLTPSGLMFADRSTRRLDLLYDNSFDAMTTGAQSDGVSWNLSWDTGVTIETTGGHTGMNFMRFPATAYNLTNQRAEDLIRRNLNGETFVFEGWARSNGAAPTTSRVLIRDYVNISVLNLDLHREGIPSVWTKVVHAFTVPPLTNRLIVILGRYSGDGIDWDDVHVWKV